MKFKKTYLVGFLFGSLIMSASAVDFTWTGTAADGDWNNAANWDANGIPVDDLAGLAGENGEGLTLDASDTITFAGMNMPTLNVPGYGGDFDDSDGGARSSPTMIFNSGGEVEFDNVGREDALWTNLDGYTRTVLTVGDGVTGVGEDVEVTIVGTNRLNRHGDGTVSIVVNEDGTLIMESNLDRWTHSGARFARIMIDGGIVDFFDVIPTANFANGSIEFLSIGGSFSANFGGAFPDEASVIAAFGNQFVNSASGGLFEVDDNGGFFTVTLVAAPDPNFWTGTGGGIWDQNTTVNFTTNLQADALVEDTFENATAISNRATFADQYFDGGVGIGVDNSTIMIGAGGVEATNVEFFNSSVAYTFESSDAFGITGLTNLSVGNTAPLTFRGDHSHTGATVISGSSTLTFDAAELEAWNYTSALGGGGGLEKTGLGSYTLAGGAGNSGTTTVTAGELIVQAESHGASAIAIASGATLTYETTTGNPRIGVTGTYSGDGVLQKTGVGGLNFLDATFALSAAALVDVQEGTLSGGSSANEDWSANLSDLNIAEGAIFTTVEANVFIDAVSGDGTLRTGFVGFGYLELTIGVANGDATFDGTVEDHDVANGLLGALTKVGTGTQTFTGANTLHENYTVEDGTVIFGSTASVTFYPTTNGITNQLLGGGVAAGTVNVDGAINVDLSATDATFGNSWLLVDDTALTVVPGATLSVTSTAGAFSQESPGVWTLNTAGNLWTFTVATGILDVSEGTPAGFGSFQTTFFTPAEITAGDADAGVDFDGGTLSNGIEFVVGGDPTDGSDDAALAPTLEQVAGGFLFTFRRTDESATDNPGVEYDTDLVGVFTPAVDGTDGVTVTVTDDGFEVGVDQVDVFLPESLAVDGRLFARLAVTPAL